MIPETAPRDGTQIIGDFGWPWPCVAAWDEYDEYWVVCLLQKSPMQDGPLNTYFEVETEGRDQLRRWMPMPKLPNVEQCHHPEPTNS